MVFDIVSPILGFEDLKKVEFELIDDFFAKIKSLDENKPITFNLIQSPKIREYEFEIPSFYKDLLKIEKNSTLLVYSILIIQDPIKNSTINLLAPLICNVEAKILAQITLDNVKYPDFHILEPISKYI